MSTIDHKQVGQIGNYYGGLHIAEVAGKFYWIIENWDTDFDVIDEWSEIPEVLYRQLETLNTPTDER